MYTRPMPIVTALLLVACGSPSATPEATGPPSETATATASASGSAKASPIPSPGAPATGGSLGITWSETDFAGPVAAVVYDDGRFVAIGGEHDALAAWTSTDGISWETHAIPGPSTSHCDPAEPICLERAPVVGPLVRLHDTLYSFGGTQFFNDVALGLAWRWTDGQPWQAVESDSDAYRAGPFRAVAASDSAIFAVTHAGYPFTERHWLWTAETRWRPVGEPISIDNPIEFRSVGWTDGRFLAVGGTWIEEPDVPQWEWEMAPGVWTSGDGDSWTSFAAPPEAEAVCSVAGLDDFFVFGVANGTAAVWRSTDGVDWVGGELPMAGGLAGCTGSVVEVSGGFIAYLGAGDRTLTWTSTDGTTWHASDELPIPTGPISVAAIDNTVLAFASRDPTTEENVPVLYVGSVTLHER